MSGIAQAIAFAVVLMLAVVGALDLDRRLARCMDRGFIAAPVLARGGGTR
jgi:hypothetical protein